MLILSCDTSGTTASAALTENGLVLKEELLQQGLVHSVSFAPMIQRLLTDCEKTPAQIDLYAAVVGPGSFTGLRIGLATFQAMASTYAKPCCGVSSLAAMAANVKENVFVLTVLDARAGRVYAALFDREKRIAEDQVIPLEKLEELLVANGLQGKELLLLGNGAELCLPYAEKICRVRCADAQSAVIRASAVARLADPSSAVEARALQPLYMTLPQAERELLARLEKTQ
ncbi:MAG: tRNA (adenosine(37)-N6)-threonylcarbamoyltransferase complex dimerization subunit type 1 TsaB [Clostridia bacterium]|nr:tRNA (adenosine(37)-N6)-threonylcarbamoyltransferase complex dimerization subunit type 1 TsaB [Clostridia bacterium]